MTLVRAKTKALALLGCALVALALLAGVGLAAQAQEPPPTPPGQGEDMAVIALEEVGTSGFQGVAVLRAAGDRTQAVVAVVPPNGLLPFVPPSEDDIGQAVIMTGSCLEPMDVVHELGEPMPIGPAMADGRTVHAIAAVVPVPLEGLLTGEYAVGVWQHTDEDVPDLRVTPVPEDAPPPGAPTPIAPQPIVPAPQMVMLACGSLLMPVPSPE